MRFRFFCVILTLIFLFPISIANAQSTSTADVVVVGDIMALSAQIGAARLKGGGYDFNYAFRYVTPIISGADLAIGNLETTIAGSKYRYKKRKKNGNPLLNAPDSLLYAVKNAGFDVLATANNHCLDFGETGLKNTLDALDRYGFLHTGTFRTKEERAIPLISEVNGIKIAVLSYTQVINSNGRRYLKKDKKYLVNRLDTNLIAADIAQAKRLGAEFVTVMVHWGREYKTRSNSYQRKTAKKIAAAGADIIIGSHPHVLQETTWLDSDTPYGKKKCFVAYSMGNFVSSMGSAKKKDSIILKLKITKGEDTNACLESVKCISTYTISGFNKKRFVILPYYNTEDFTGSARVIKTLKSSYNRARKIINRKNNLEFLT